MKNVLGRGLTSLVSTKPQATVRAGNLAESPKLEAKQVAVEVAAKPLTLISTTDSGEKIYTIPVADICSGKYQPRLTFEESEIKDLAQSIQTHGVLQPILVRKGKFSDGFSYEIIAGERRWRASKSAGLLEIPAIVKDLSNQDALEIAIVENIQRENLNAIEEALSYQRLAQEFSLTQEQVAAKVGKERASISNSMRLLKLPEEIQKLVGSNELSVGHAKCLLSIKESSAQISLAKKAIAESLSVRKLEELISRVVVLDTGTRKATEQIEKSAKDTSASNPYPEIMERLRNALGTKVLVKQRKDGSGCIEIAYHSESELDRLVEVVAPG